MLARKPDVRLASVDDPWRPIEDAPLDRPVLVTQRGTARMEVARYDPHLAKPRAHGWAMAGNWRPTHFAVLPAALLALWWTCCHHCNPESWFCIHLCGVLGHLDLDALLGVATAFAGC